MLESEGICTRFSEEVNKYLESKLPDIPGHTKMEISEFLGHKVGCLLIDLEMALTKELKHIYEKRISYGSYPSRRDKENEEKERKND